MVPQMKVFQHHIITILYSYHRGKLLKSRHNLFEGGSLEGSVWRRTKQSAVIDLIREVTIAGWFWASITSMSAHPYNNTTPCQPMSSRLVSLIVTTTHLVYLQFVHLIFIRFLLDPTNFSVVISFVLFILLANNTHAYAIFKLPNAKIL